jgi:hypothetical protein
VRLHGTASIGAYFALCVEETAMANRDKQRKEPKKPKQPKKPKI